MSGRELDPDGTDSYHPQHPWEQVGHPLYLPPGQRTRLNWPPEPARPAGPHEARTWDQLPVRVKPDPAWDREYRPMVAPPRPVSLRCALGIHAWDYNGHPQTHAPAPIRCHRCGRAH